MSAPADRRGWVLYDGGCPLCSGLVERFRSALEPRGFGFAPFQEGWVRERLSLAAGEVPGEMKVLPPEGGLLGGVGAVLYLASRIPWAKPLAWIGGLPGIRHLLDREYRRIAANRIAISGACPLPSALDADRRRSVRVSAVSAGIGAALWSLFAAAGLAGVLSLGPIPVVFLLAPLILVPLAFRLLLRGADSSVNPGLFRAAVLLQPLAAGAVLLSFLLPPGVPGGLLAVPWLLLCLLLALAGLFRLFLGGFARLEEVAIDVGLLFLPVGGGWLLLSRLGASPIGFEEPIVMLTAVHFHFTAFLAPLLAGMAGRIVKKRGLYRLSVLGLLLGTPSLAVGWTLHSPGLKLAAVALLSLSLTLLALLGLRGLGAIRDGRAEGLLGLSFLSLLAGMALAFAYGLGEFRGTGGIAIPDMALAHGLANGLGFCLCGVLGWVLEIEARNAEER